MVTAGALPYSTFDLVCSAVMVHRRVASVAFVALVVGCSYDWNIGTGSADTSSGAPSGTSTPSRPTTDGGGARDTGARDTGTPPAVVRECGATCECKDGDTCLFTCTTGACNARCTDESKCTLTCVPGAECSIACEDDAECDLDCSKAQAARCLLTCEDRADCRGTCGPATFCTRNCPRDCDLACLPGAICTGN